MGCMTQKEELLVLIKLIFIGGISVISSLASTSDYDIAREGARTPAGSPSRPISVAPDDSFHGFLDKYENLIVDRILQEGEKGKPLFSIIKKPPQGVRKK